MFGKFTGFGGNNEISSQQTPQQNTRSFLVLNKREILFGFLAVETFAGCVAVLFLMPLKLILDRE